MRTIRPVLLDNAVFKVVLVALMVILPLGQWIQTPCLKIV